MFDVAIIGAGVIGASIFRELTKYNLNVIIIEKENDVSMGTSKANSAIVHAGYDPKIGTLMAKYNVKGSEMFETLCKDLSVPYKNNGSLIIGFNDEDMKVINDLYENGNKLGVKGLEVLNKEEVLYKEKNLSVNVKGALYAPTGAIVGPFELTIALIENGLLNGGKIKIQSEVVKIEKGDNFKITTSNKELIEARYIINAAGVYADNVHNLIGKESFEINPIKGSYYVLDRNQGELIEHTIFQCPSKLGKGVLVTPTAHRNILVGPDAEEAKRKDELFTTSDNLEFIKSTAMKTTEKINFRECIRTFAGLRANSDRGDFIVEEASDVKGFIDVAGIKSPGLSSAPAIALDVVNILEKCGLQLVENKTFNPIRKQIWFMGLSEEEKDEIIRKDPRYGRVICRCEGITEGEIVEVIKNCFGSITLDGVKRRCRPGMGRCQGGFCGPIVQEIIARELNVNMEDVLLEKNRSYILTGKTKNGGS